MTALDVLLRLALVGVFCVSAVAKALDRAGSARSVRAFGVPDGLVAPVAAALPLLEAAGALLLLGWALPARIGAILLLALLAAFTTGVIVNLVGDRQPDCHCFGKLSTEPISWRIVWRNSVLGAASAILALSPARWLGPSLIGAVQAASTWQVVTSVVLLGLLAAAVVLTITVAGLRRELRIAAFRNPVGGWSLESLVGGRYSLGDLTAGGTHAAIVFVAPSCGPCGAMRPLFGSWRKEVRDRAALVLASAGDRDAIAEKFTGIDVPVLIDSADDLARVYGVDATPALVLVGPDGQPLGEPAYGREDILFALLPYATSLPLDESAAPSAPVLEIGSRPPTELPDFQLLGVDDEVVRVRDAVADFERSVVLLWDSDCGFCARLEPDIADWALRRESGIGLVVVTTDAPGGLRADFAGATVLHDPSFTLGHHLGAGGTPSALLVTSAATSLSAVAEGGNSVKNLLDLTHRVMDKP